MSAIMGVKHDAAVLATFVRLQTMADGGVRIVLDLQCSLQDVAAMGLIPGVPFALARMTKEAAANPQSVMPTEKPGPLCIMACTFCADPMFWKWLTTQTSADAVTSEAEAKETICFMCCIDSRKELDTDSRAADAFHRQIRRPFIAWRDSANPRERAA